MQNRTQCQTEAKQISDELLKLIERSRHIAEEYGSGGIYIVCSKLRDANMVLNDIMHSDDRK